jgi:hypothetical protein
MAGTKYAKSRARNQKPGHSVALGEQVYELAEALAAKHGQTMRVWLGQQIRYAAKREATYMSGVEHEHIWRPIPKTAQMWCPYCFKTAPRSQAGSYAAGKMGA